MADDDEINLDEGGAGTAPEKKRGIGGLLSGLLKWIIIGLAAIIVIVVVVVVTVKITSKNSTQVTAIPTSDEYVSGHKEEYEKFLKSINNIYKVYSINLYELNQTDLLEDLNVFPLALPHFIIYDRNYRILYKDNLFQETPESLKNICHYEVILPESLTHRVKFINLVCVVVSVINLDFAVFFGTVSDSVNGACHYPACPKADNSVFTISGAV